MRQEGSAIAEMLSDYAVMREQAKIGCEVSNRRTIYLSVAAFSRSS